MSKFKIEWVTMTVPKGITEVQLDGETFEVVDGKVEVPNVVISHAGQKGTPETFVSHLLAQGFKTVESLPTDKKVAVK